LRTCFAPRTVGGSTHPEAFGFVPDPADRKFAALADAVQAPLVVGFALDL